MRRSLYQVPVLLTTGLVVLLSVVFSFASVSQTTPPSFLLQWDGWDGGGGQFSSPVGAQGSGTGQFESPDGIAVAPDGIVFISDTGNNRISVFTSSGAFLRQWGPGTLSAPSGIAVHGTNVAVADSGNKRIIVFDINGGFIRLWGSGAYAFSDPTGVAVDSAGNVYVANADDRRFQVFTITGTMRLGQSAEFVRGGDA